MRTIIVDDDRKSLEQLENLCAMLGKSGPPACFEHPARALAYALENKPEVLIAETGLPGMDGFELCRKIRRLSPEIIPVFVTEDKTRALEAFEEGAAAYLVKPFTKQQLENALNRAERLCRAPPKCIEIRTFGYFDVFINGRPLRFSRQKSKEILAYLVDRRGGIATTQQILADLWEDKAGEKSAMTSFQTAFKALRKDLEAVGAAHILISNRNQKAVNTAWMDCDYYRLLEGEPAALEEFPGQYMAEYSWAETTNANCIHLRQAYEERKKRLFNKDVEKLLKNR